MYDDVWCRWWLVVPRSQIRGLEELGAQTARVYSKVLAICDSNYQQYVRPNVSD